MADSQISNRKSQITEVQSEALAHRARKRLTRRVALAVAALVGAGLALAAAMAWPERDPARLRARAKAEFEAHRWDRVAAALDQLARLGPLTPADWLLRGMADLARDRPDAALADLEHLPDGDKLAPTARLKAGQIELRRGRVRSAEAWLRRAVALDPGLIQARRELIYIYGMQLRRRLLDEQFLALERLTPLKADQVFLWGLTHSTVWNAEEVSQDLRRFLRADPGDRWSRLALAENLIRMGRPDEALSALEPLPESDPEALALRARVVEDRGDRRRAEALLAMGPADHPALALLRGRAALRRRDWATAARHFRIGLAADPLDREALSGLGNALRLSGDPAAAEPYLKAAADLGALQGLMERASHRGSMSDPELLRALGAACETVGRRAEARAWYRLAVTRDPTDKAAQEALYRLRDAGSKAS
jgi:tetratricopeptide (TPR) repeat protein